MGRLTKIWKCRTLPLAKKVTLYSSLVRSLLTYGLASRVLTPSQMSRLEATQTRHLRRIGESPAHIERESNESLRTRLHFPSFETWLRKLRLGVWRKLALYPQPAVTGAVLGGINFDSRECNRERANLLRNDLLACTLTAPLVNGLTWNSDNTICVDQFFWHSLSSLSKSQINKTLEFTSSADRKNKTLTGPCRELTFACTQCSKKFATNAGLQTHRTKTHSVVHPPRALVTSAACPLRDATFAKIRGAQLHAQRVCSKKFAHAQIDETTAQVHANVNHPGQLHFPAFLN